MAKYTTPTNIARKLKGRLNIDIATPDSSLLNDTVIYPVDTPSQLVDESLLFNIITEQESLVDLTLSQIYQLPLRNQHPILTNIVDNLVISELIEIHFLGNAGFGSLSIDLGQYGNNARSKAYSYLASLVAGWNIAIIGAPVEYQQYGQNPRRKLTLPGELIRQNEPDRILDYGSFEMGKYGEERDAEDEGIYKETYDSSYLIEEDFTKNPFSMDYDRHYRYEE